MPQLYEGWTDVIRAPIKFASVQVDNIPGVRIFDADQSPQLTTNVAVSSSEHASQDPSQGALPTPANHDLNDCVSLPSTDSGPSPRLLLTHVNAVQTRASKMKRVHPLVLPTLQPLNVMADDFARLQDTCKTLSTSRAKAASGEVDQVRNGSTYQFVTMNGLLCRKCLTSNRPYRIGTSELVLPRDCRPNILSVAHESPLSGNFIS